MLGKTRRPEMRAVFDDYIKRISRSCPIEIAEVRDAHAALKKLDADRAATVVLLDAAGKNLDSNVLANGSANSAIAALPSSSSFAAMQTVFRQRPGSAANSSLLSSP